MSRYNYLPDKSVTGIDMPGLVQQLSATQPCILDKPQQAVASQVTIRLDWLDGHSTFRDPVTYRPAVDERGRPLLSGEIVVDLALPVSFRKL